MTGSPARAPNTAAEPDPLELVSKALAGMRFGIIQLTVHDGKLVQIDVTERRRFT
jgi:hypothetical protein